MNSNNYLGMALRSEVVAAEEAAAASYGVGPGAVRFISGTWSSHVALERRLAAFHGRPAAMLFSSAYAAIMGIIPPLVTDRTAVISDELNHNCIINAIALARPAEKHIYKHLDMGELERRLEAAAKNCARAIMVTDGVFSMRGDHAPLDRIMVLARGYDSAFAEGAIVVVDDSHGVGAFGPSGRGTEEYHRFCPRPICSSRRSARRSASMAVTSSPRRSSSAIFARRRLSTFIRTRSRRPKRPPPTRPSTSWTVRRASALLAHLRAMTARFKAGLIKLGFETLPGEHPVVPLLVRDTARTLALVSHLRQRGILATGLTYPVVPKGDEEIRFQISADHTPADIDAALEALADVAA